MSMGRDLQIPLLEERVDMDVRESATPPEWDDAEWSSLRERARHLVAEPIAPAQDLLAAIEPELLENNYTLQAFSWVPPDRLDIAARDVPRNEKMLEFHSDETRAPLADAMVSRFFRAAGEYPEPRSLLVVFHPPGFGPWCIRGEFLADLHACDVWAPRLPEHGVVNGRRQPLQHQSMLGHSRVKVWRDWLEDVRAVLDSHSSDIRVLVPWELSALIEPFQRVLGPQITLEVVDFQSESNFFELPEDWSPVPLQLVWRQLARGLSVLVEEDASTESSC